MDDHIADLEAIVDREDLNSFVLGGWSMGVQISLEYYHRHPEKVKALILLNGAYEYVLSTAFHIPGANTLFPSILKFGQVLSPAVSPLLTYLFNLPNAVQIIHTMRIVSANFEFFHKMVKEFAKLDWKVYFELMLRLNRHSAAEYLSEVKVPTLITAGTKDAMTPMDTSEKMHREIAGSELFIIPNGTHYTIAEYPEILNLRLAKFFEKID
jgi:pimeloyl-ACP methyl ester carboxylesterase